MHQHSHQPPPLSDCWWRRGSSTSGSSNKVRIILKCKDLALVLCSLIGEKIEESIRLNLTNLWFLAFRLPTATIFKRTCFLKDFGFIFGTPIFVMKVQNIPLIFFFSLFAFSKIRCAKNWNRFCLKSPSHSSWVLLIIIINNNY